MGRGGRTLQDCTKLAAGSVRKGLKARIERDGGALGKRVWENGERE